MWSSRPKSINARYIGTGTILADIAIEKFTSYRFNPSLSIEDNLTEFQSIVCELRKTGSDLTLKALASRLVNSLPKSWDAFKQGCGLKEEKDKLLDTLIEMITAEDARRKAKEPQEDATALAARVKG